MFEGFARQWTPLLPSGEVTAEPRGLRVAGEDLVVWRPPGAGVPGVLLDRCPHRGVSLALGRHARGGGLACAFHGWEFGTDGACRHVPFSPDAPLRRLGATALPVRETAGYVWVFTGFEAEGEPNVHPELGSPGFARHDHWEEWDCHWSRAMENMLDYPHLPFIHRTTIGRFVRTKMRRDSRLHLAVHDAAHGFDVETQMDGRLSPASLSWYRPHGMVLDTTPAPRIMRLHIWCVPIEENRTRMILAAVRNFARNPAMSVALDRFNITVLRQDRDVVESSDPPEVPAGTAERSVPTDGPTLAFRTWYLRHLKGTTVADPRAAAKG